MAIFSGTRAPGPAGASTAAAAPTNNPHMTTRARVPALRTLRRAAHPAHSRVVGGERGSGAGEAGVAVVEDTTVGGQQPVAAAVAGRCHAHDGLGQRDATGRTEEGGVAVAEDAGGRGHQPL